jgi:4-hydroxy-4-methyl-2-oxoglutarate aldolase
MTSSLLSILEELRDFDTALLANTIEYIDPTPAHEYYMAGYIQSVTPGLGPTVGIAVTCEMDTSTPTGPADTEGFWLQVEEITAMKVPTVWVVKAVGARPEHECILGDGMAKTLFAAGCIGVVTDGGVRDAGGMASVPFAAYCRGITIHHTALRVTAINRPVEIGGITISPGDVVHANGEGVIKIPQGCLPALAENATRMRAFEHEAHCVMRRTDITPAEKRRRVGELTGKYGFTQCV